MVAVSGRSFVRSRWVTVGVTVAIALGAGGVLTSSAADSPAVSSFVPITPCRLMDTRSGSTVGPRSTPIAAETYVATVWGTNGKCTIPTTATAVSLNVTFVGPTAGGFLSVFPADKPWPGTSNLNFAAGQSPSPNAVTSALSADGKLAFLNEAGKVNLITDIVGYYLPAASAPADPCAAFVGTYFADNADGDVAPDHSGLIIQVLAGGAMSVVPADNIDPGVGVTVEETTAQEGRWSCTGSNFNARTLDMFRQDATVFTLGRWDWAGFIAPDGFHFTRTLCDFDLPLTQNVQTFDCSATAVVYAPAVAVKVTVPTVTPAAVTPASASGTPTGRRP